MDLFTNEDYLKKIKPLTTDQILITLDRLTRFKEPEKRYMRVFTEIIVSNLIEPKYKKSDIENMDFISVTELATEIINYSLASIGLELCEDFVINQEILDYEKKIFNIDLRQEILLKNKINYAAAVKLIPDNAVFNLRWLKSLAKEKCSAANRASNLYPVEKVLLVEGITEEILLPAFAKLMGYDFKKSGVFVISAGGKNQVVKYFYRFAQCLKIPIFVLLDSDAQENFEQIQPRLREGDYVHVISKGEFEDILPKNLIKKTINYETENISMGDTAELENAISTVEFLEEFFRKRGLHEFKKAEFAQFVKENITTSADVSEEIKEILQRLKNIVCYR